ncbi:helix-turn-helix domain-containing protein [Companilactobacillus baiquanensis]|uniref:Helix-turn-helix domain-containing protein n=1 Tax=Companilactobacillus baiquanensis TaxID=2486005 RepID=A0ABW1UW91_9LACO|nr:helix-turn-helix transcriptional regulator [Companilactobacillus baiquanensis]
MTTGQRIAKLRVRKNLSQPQLADILHVSQSTVAMWESNRRNVSNDDLKKLSKYFKVSTDYLLGNNEEPELLANHLDINYKDLSDDQKKQVKNFIKFLRDQNEEN